MIKTIFKLSLKIKNTMIFLLFPLILILGIYLSINNSLKIAKNNDFAYFESMEIHQQMKKYNLIDMTRNVPIIIDYQNRYLK